MNQHTGEVSPLSDFDLAAVACGYDPSSTCGAEAARRDHRVWDLLDAWAITNPLPVADAIANARHDIASSTQRPWS